jgi:hypothetical protein
MKISPLILFPLLFAACASRPTNVVRTGAHDVPGTSLPGKGIQSVRYAENIKTYPLGRYIDPNNSRIMHEGHSIYRVETTAKWNLHPNEPVAMPRGPFHIRDSARTNAPIGNELVAQLHQQKEATRAIIQGGEVVSQKLGELSGKLQQTQEIAAQNALLKQDVNAARQRLDALEEQLRAKPLAAPTKQQSEPFEKSKW